jgi:hypothetical protein
MSAGTVVRIVFNILVFCRPERINTVCARFASGRLRDLVCECAVVFVAYRGRRFNTDGLAMRERVRSCASVGP